MAFFTDELRRSFSTTDEGPFSLLPFAMPENSSVKFECEITVIDLDNLQSSEYHFLGSAARFSSNDPLVNIEYKELMKNDGIGLAQDPKIARNEKSIVIAFSGKQGVLIDCALRMKVWGGDAEVS